MFVGRNDTLTKGNDNVYLYLPLFEYTRSRDLFIYLNKDTCSNMYGPPIKGEYVSILMRGRYEPTSNEEIDNDKYNVTFVSHSRILQSYYTKSEVCHMRSLFKNLHNAVTQASLHTSSQTNKWLIIDKQLLSKKTIRSHFVLLYDQLLVPLLNHYPTMTQTCMMKKRMTFFPVHCIVVGIKTLIIQKTIDMFLKSVNFRTDIKVILHI